MSANDKQVGGDHYKSSIQHWDFVLANDLDYFQSQITKYVSRWKKKNGLKDLEKAQHFLEKYIEVEKLKRTTIQKFPSSKEYAKQSWPNSFQYPGVFKKSAEMKHPFGYDANLETGEIIGKHPLIGLPPIDFD